ncbi:MAG: hypothetical protein JRI95_13825 [Deltaproteobacteria bacterium]|nr:hypothetical protein [Deltaproteobacteria bacterium]
MKSEIITIRELSKLSGLSEKALRVRANSESWPFQHAKGRGRGGRVKHFITASLPEEIKKTIQSSTSEKQVNHEESEKSLSSISSESSFLPTSTNGSGLAEWSARPESCREEARRRLGMVNKARSIKSRNPKQATPALKRYALSQGVSLATLYKYMKEADQAIKAAQSIGQDAVMAQILALTPGYGNNRGACRAFSKEAIAYAKGLWLSQEFLNFSDVYDQTINEASIRGWKFGSYNSLLNVLNQQMDESLKVLARQGVKRYQADYELKILRDYKEIWSNFMWCGDHHIFDVFVKGPGGKILRPWLTAWMDMASRSFMGWCISFQPNSKTIALALAHAISEKKDINFPQHGLPWSVYVDNGKDYRSKYLNGESVQIGPIDYPEIMERFAALGIDPFYIDLDYDPGQGAWVKKRGNLNVTIKNVRVGGVYARLNIHQRYATAYHPWAKPIERAFINVVQSFSRQQPGWCGSGHDQRPEKLAHEIKTGAILDFEEFCERWYQWVVYGYNKTPHSGHGMDGRSPNEVFQAFGAPEKVEPELLTFALFKKEQVKIHNWGGFKLMGREFELDIPSDLSGAAVLNKLINRFVTVFFDFDLKMTRVYLDGKYVCDGRRLRRASFIRPDDPVMMEKIKLQAYQGQLNKAALANIQKEVPPPIGHDHEALLALTTGGMDRDENQVNTAEADCSQELIPFSEEERYRMILKKLAKGESLSEADREFQAEYEAGEEYRQMQKLYEADFSYLKHQHGRRVA